MKDKTKRKIYSRHYERLMQRPWDKRHTVRNQRRYGVWRWRGMYEYRGIIVPILDEARAIIDYGGALGPLGFASTIVDVEPKSITGEKVLSPNVSNDLFVQGGEIEVDGLPVSWDVLRPEVVFSSHTLEHVKDLGAVLSDLKAMLRPDGTLILHLPSDRNAKHWHPAATDKHKRLFTLIDKHDPAYVRIDKVIGEFMDVDVCDYCGDASIILIARKR